MDSCRVEDGGMANLSGYQLFFKLIAPFYFLISFDNCINRSRKLLTCASYLENSSYRVMLMVFHLRGHPGLRRLKCLELSDTEVGNNGLRHLSGEVLTFKESAESNDLPQRNEVFSES